TLARLETVLRAVASVVSVTCQEPELRFSIRFIHHVKSAMLGRNQRGKLGEDEFANRQKIALSLQHPGELREVGLEHVLFLVPKRGVSQITNLFVDVVFAECDLDL